MLNKLKIWQKMVLIGLAWFIPLILTTYLLLEEKSIKIDFAQAELHGAEYINVLRRVQIGLLEYRTLLLTNDPNAPSRTYDYDVARTRATLDEAFRDLGTVDSRLSDPLLTSRSELAKRNRQHALPADLSRRWQSARTEGDRGVRIAQVTALAQGIRDLITHVGDSSKLILDPDLDTYYIMDALLLREPETIKIAFELHDAAYALIRRQSATLNERIAVSQLVGRLRDMLEGLRQDLQNAHVEQQNFSHHAGLADATGPKLATADAGLEAMLAGIQDGIVLVDVPRLTAAQLQSTLRTAIDAHKALWEELIRQENIMLTIRQDGDYRRRSVALWMVVGAVVAAIILTILIMRSITVPLGRATGIARMITQGKLPDRVEAGGSRDETGLLLKSLDDMIVYLDLRSTTQTLQQAAQLLTDAVVNLERQAVEQNEAVTRQAAALQETQVTAQEIKQTSQLAAERAQQVLQMAERADDISRAGETAIELSLSGLAEISRQVEAIASTIAGLTERTVQIGGITQTVKDLADQSNMLALNAAVEAVRSGEHGKGFAVVAREIRSLADQSIQATNRVKEILDDISNAVRHSAASTEAGLQRMEGGMVQVKTSGDKLRELSTIVRENSQGVRQIAAAVSQQNAGITQVFGAVSDQTTMMNATVQRLEALRESSRTVRDVSKRVADLAGRYRKMFTDAEGQSAAPGR